MPPTTTIDLHEVKRLILTDLDIWQVADALGTSKRQLERVFLREVGETPAAWRRSQIGPRDRGAPVVSFRLPEHDALVAAAEVAGVEPGAWARSAVQAALKASGRKRRKS